MMNGINDTSVDKALFNNYTRGQSGFRQKTSHEKNKIDMCEKRRKTEINKENGSMCATYNENRKNDIDTYKTRLYNP